MHMKVSAQMCKSIKLHPFDSIATHLKIALGNDRKAFFHFGRNRKATGRELSILAGTVIPVERLSTGRYTLILFSFG